VFDLKRSYYDKGLWARFRDNFTQTGTPEETNLPSAKVLKYLESSYPSNHNYVLKQGQLIPLGKLAGRCGKIASLYPAGFESLLDVSCSKGYFAFDAVQKFSCDRSMGIDVIEEELEACSEVQKYLGDTTTVFKRMRLHEQASRIDEFGGPFDVVLLINCYQYLYFGSKRFKEAYLSHDQIFSDLRKVCQHRLIFSNRIEVDRLQSYPASIARSPDLKEPYDDAAVFEAASRYFKVNHMGRIGRNPLWSLDTK
jgi:hypothetical protein